MIKPQSLRSALESSVLELKKNPDKLRVFVNKGNTASTSGGSLSFSYAYTLQLVVIGFSSDPDAIMLPIIAWLRENQPDALDGTGKKFSFEVELINNKEFDISIELELTESVQVSLQAKNKKGDYAATLVHLPEPPLETWPDIEQWTLFICGEEVAHWSSNPHLYLPNKK